MDDEADDVCLECGEDAQSYPDPRTPMVDTGDCLCMTCHEAALIEVVDGLKMELEEAEARLHKFQQDVMP